LILVWLAAMPIRPVGAEPLPDEFMTVDRIRPGMVGEGRTVFQGYKIETFKAEILGVEYNSFAGGDIIYARLSGGPLEQHGVAAGMSGSPVYIDGKLIGAVAYSWSFAYKPYCGITPIEQMWTVFRNIGKLPRPVERRGGAGGVAGGVGQPWNWQADWDRYQAALNGQADPPSVSRGFRPNLPALTGVEGELRPLTTPLFLSGASPQTERLLRRYFASRGLELFGSGSLSGSSGGRREPAPPIEAGSALGVPLLSGDLALAAVGTATWRRGDRLIAFGHPMFFDGSVNVPMAPAYIFGIMQSYARPFKLGEVGEAVGTIDQDRLYGVGGMFGPTPPRVPITVRVEGDAVANARPYSFSCWEDPDMLPTLTLAALQEAYVTSVAEGGKLTADVRYTITLGDGRRVEKTLRASAEGMVVNQPLSSLLMDLFLLLKNPFAEADLASIDVGLRVWPGRHEDALLAVQTDHDAYKAGEAVRLTATIRPWRGDDYEHCFSIRLPEDLQPGPYVLHVIDAAGAQRMDRMMHPGHYQPRTFDEVVDLVRRVDQPANQLGVALLEPAIDLDLRGEVLGRLPASVEGLIQATAAPRDRQPAVGHLLAQQTFQTPGPVSGSQTVLIQVVDHFDE
jgi:hypothetical protein